MRILWCLLGFVCGSLSILEAHPVSSLFATGPRATVAESHASGWLMYMFGLFAVVVLAFAIIGCMCCKRQRFPKGFQDTEGKLNQEFKDGHTSSGCDLAFENPISGLELVVPQSGSRLERICFEPLPLDCFVPQTSSFPTLKPKLPHSTPLTSDQSWSSPIHSCNEWFDSTIHIPRERLKYLREIGHGWFGKVVEGRADLETTEGVGNVVQNKGVIVRILTEEATNQEKSWFLREVMPYLKLRHRNILLLLGTCLETDPYLLLFESCPLGDLKGFLKSNSDTETREALLRGHVPKRMAIEVAAGLEHMHVHGFAHTDLAARNCLVASDLSIKLGDYGTSIEKYPTDYHVVGDRALPIRWAAPESLKCTDTTIETLEITVKANLWSYAVLLWEIVTWGKIPYDHLCDEEVIQAVLSSTDATAQSITETNFSELLLKCPEDCPQNFYHVMRSCWVIDPDLRPGLDQVQQVLETQDFELRWETLRPNTLQDRGKSASLFNLHGSIDSDGWISPHISDGLIITNNNEKVLSTSFRLGPEEPVKNVPGIKASNTIHETDSETEEESWLDRVKRGAYTEKVRQKSKSVADLMVLVHIDSDSEAEWSLGIQGPEQTKKRLTSAGSDSNLKSTVLADEFTETLKKLRNPLQTQLYDHSAQDDFNVCKIDLARETSDTTNVLTLTTDFGQRPMLRLSTPKNVCPTYETSQKSSESVDFVMSEDLHEISETLAEQRVPLDKSEVKSAVCSSAESSNVVSQEVVHPEEHILRLVPKSNPCPPLLRLVPDPSNAPERFQPSDISKQEKLKDGSNPIPDTHFVDRIRRVPNGEEGGKQNVSEICDKMFGRHFNDIQNTTENLEQCNLGSKNSAINYSNIITLVETEKVLNEKSLSLENICNRQSDKAIIPDLEIENPEERKSADVKSFSHSDASPKPVVSPSLKKDPAEFKATECDEFDQSNMSLNNTSPQLLGPHASSEKCTRQKLFSGNETNMENKVKKKSDVTGGREDSKRLSTPDDERSSDSGFRDKESCEEEESPAVPTQPSQPCFAMAEDEHLFVISELDAILDAESPGNFADLDDVEELISPDSIDWKITHLDNPKSENYNATEELDSSDDHKGWFLHSQKDTCHQLLRTNSGTNADIEDNIDNLALDVLKPEIQTSDTKVQVKPVMCDPSLVPNEANNFLDGHPVLTGDQLYSMNESIEAIKVSTEDPGYLDSQDGLGSTESLHSDNSYISFGLEDEYVVAIRKELSEKLPHAQMPVEETREPCDSRDLTKEDEMNITDHQNWNDEEGQTEQGSGVVDISIRYNIYNTPLSPILEERENFSIITSESLASKDSYEDSFLSKHSGSSNNNGDEDLLLVDVATNKAVLVDGDRDPFTEGDKEDQDTSNVDISDDETFEYRIAMPDLNQEPEKQLHAVIGGSAPLPSPEDELKWQQLSLSFPLPPQNDLMSTSFSSKHDWDSQDDDNSSSSGEFIWKEGERLSPRCGRLDPIDQLHDNSVMDGIKEETEMDEEDVGDLEEDGEGDEEDLEFTPSAWDATLAPHRSALRSPDKTQRPDQKKSVWFKKQRYHCVYEYPKEVSTATNQEQAITDWKPTSYADWEELMEEPARLDLYPIEYDDADENGEEFYVSSSNRPFQFQTGEGEQVSQFFPGASSSLLQQQRQQQQQLGELRHTRDRLKLNLPLTESQPSITSAAPTTSPAEEHQETLVADLKLDTLGTCEAGISCDKHIEKDENVNQNVTSDRISPPLFEFEDKSIA
ncbi:uncharacterized protein LOC105689443 isoform X2 [Athalia rosae]|uniref:uncharacterized protein LOC105689443 isoform X2 n=1 Tax=Athalia rosae TaxID=37344 RepID=UPI0020334B26|nr:uncharacterized protein LOC105689443 isoform X2 [Athalia rosae]